MVIEFEFTNKKIKKFEGGSILESGLNFIKNQQTFTIPRMATKEEEEFYKKSLSSHKGSEFVEVKHI